MKRIFNHQLLGGVLLIAGTTLGAGMLAFPTVTAFGGFFPSILLFVAIWAVMLASSFCFLDANLSLKGQANMISMAEQTLGTWGKLVAWTVYLLLLYSLAAAYIAGCTPLVVEGIQAATGYTIPKNLSFFILPLIFGGVIYSGTRGVDLFNRVLMSGLVIAYLLLASSLPDQVHFQKLMRSDWPAISIAIPIVTTAFGYHIVIPSLATYMDRNRTMLVQAILIGSAIPFFVYILWQVLVFGSVPFSELIVAYKQGVTAAEPLAHVLNNPLIVIAAKLFAFFAIVTSFIGVTLSLADFLTDGFKISQTQSGRVIATLLTFLPPLFFVYTYQRGFYAALQYAGAFIAILLIFLPAAMVWNLKKYRHVGGRLFLIALIGIALAIIVLDILQETGQLNQLLAS